MSNNFFIPKPLLYITTRNQIRPIPIIYLSLVEHRQNSQNNQEKPITKSLSHLVTPSCGNMLHI